MAKMTFGNYATRDFSDNLIDKAAALAELHNYLRDHKNDADAADDVGEAINAICNTYEKLLSAHTTPENPDDYIYYGYFDLFALGVDSGRPSFCEYTDELYPQPLDCQFELSAINQFRKSTPRGCVYHDFVFDNDPELLICKGEMEEKYPHLFGEK